MPQMYVEYRDGVPVAYRYDEEWVAMPLYIEGGYPTPEEAVEAWNRYAERIFGRTNDG